MTHVTLSLRPLNDAGIYRSSYYQRDAQIGNSIALESLNTREDEHVSYYQSGKGPYANVCMFSPLTST